MAQPIDLPDCAKRLLQFLYPTVDWSRVTFFSGLPYWASSDTTGITIPDPLGLSGFNVYLGKYTDFCDDDAISQLVHESFHIQQFMGIGLGYGVGWMRPSFYKYFVCFLSGLDFRHHTISEAISNISEAISNAYYDNPFEVAAYAQEAAFRNCYSVKACDCTTGKPVFNPAALDNLKTCNESLIVTKPIVPHCGRWWVYVFALLLAPFVALIGFLMNLNELLDCEYLKVKSQQCAQWGKNVRRECSQWADHGYHQCNKWADEGYSVCGKWSTFATSHCCTWKPCSWFCKVLVWVTTTICTLAVWIPNLVCKLTVWIVNLVCILWTWLVESICLFWLTFWRIFFLCWLR